MIIDCVAVNVAILGWVRREIGGELIPIPIHFLFCEVRVRAQAVRPEKSWPLAKKNAYRLKGDYDSVGGGS